MFSRFISRALILTALTSFILHSDSAWAMEIKPHVETALDVFSTTILPEAQRIFSQIL